MITSIDTFFAIDRAHMKRNQRNRKGERHPRNNNNGNASVAFSLLQIDASILKPFVLWSLSLGNEKLSVSVIRPWSFFLCFSSSLPPSLTPVVCSAAAAEAVRSKGHRPKQQTACTGCIKFSTLVTTLGKPSGPTVRSTWKAFKKFNIHGRRFLATRRCHVQFPLRTVDRSLI